MKRARPRAARVDQRMGVGGNVFDLHGSEYEQLVDRSIAFTGRNTSFFARRKVEVLRRIEEKRGRDLRDEALLDVGCGSGTTDRFLVGHVRTLHGVDISEGMLAAARQNVPDAHFQSYDGMTLPFDHATFDVVVAICALHHVPPTQRQRFVAELNRVSRSGALIAIFEHNPINPLTRWAVRGCELDDGVELLPARRVKQLLSASGAEVFGCHYLLFTPCGGKLGAGVDRWLQAVPVGGQHVVTAEAVDR